MLRRFAFVIAPVLLATGVSTPSAVASHQNAACRFLAFSQSTITGQEQWEGGAGGFVEGDAGEAVSVRCVVKVGSSIRSATDWRSGSTISTTGGRVTYVRALFEVPQLCVQYSTSHGLGETCFATTTFSNGQGGYVTIGG